MDSSKVAHPCPKCGRETDRLAANHYGRDFPLRCSTCNQEDINQIVDKIIKDHRRRSNLRLIQGGQK